MCKKFNTPVLITTCITYLQILVAKLFNKFNKLEDTILKQKNSIVKNTEKIEMLLTIVDKPSIQ